MRKKLRQALRLGAVCLLLVAGLTPTRAQQTVEDYGVLIDGTALTLSNYQQVLRKYAGVSFDPQARKLTLRNARMRVDALAFTKPITIELFGHANVIEWNRWSEKSAEALRVASEVSVTKGGVDKASLRIEAIDDSSGPIGIAMASNSRLVIGEGVSLYACGTRYGVFATEGVVNAVLEVRGMLYTYGQQEASLRGVTLEMGTGVEVRYPVGATYSDTDRKLVHSGKEVNVPALVGNTEHVDYGISISEMKLNSVTMAFPMRLQVEAWQRGSAEYDEENNVLTLKSLIIGEKQEDINYVFVVGEIPNLDRLTIQLEGENLISAEESSLFKIERAHLTLRGPGVLTLKAPGYQTALDIHPPLSDHSITVERGADISIEAGYGIHAYYSEMATLTLIVKDERLDIKATHAAIVGAKRIEAGDGVVHVPGSNSWELRDNINVNSEELNGVAVDKLSGQPLHSLNTYAKPLDITIGGMSVTEGNVGNLSTPGFFPALKSGTLAYDQATKTLSMTDAVIDVTDSEYSALRSSLPEISLRLNGKNHITSLDQKPLELSKATVEGEYGELFIRSERATQISELTIDNSSVRIEAQGLGGWQPVLEVKRLEMKGDGRLRIKARKGRVPIAKPFSESLTFTSGPSMIHVPAGAKFENNELVDSEGKPVKTSVYIGPASESAQPLGLMLGGVEVTTFNYDRLEELETDGTPVVPGLKLAQGGAISYDPSSNKLQMRHVQLSTRPDEYGIRWIRDEELTLAAEGINKVSAGMSPLTMEGNVVMMVDSLMLSSAQGIGVEIVGPRTLNLTGNLRVLAKQGGIWGVNDDAVLLVSAGSSLQVAAEGELVKGIASFTPDESLGIVRPVDAKYDAAKKGIVGGTGSLLADGEMLLGAQSEASLGIFVGGRELTMAQSNVPLTAGMEGWEIAEGQLLYNGSTNQLELTDFKGMLRISALGVRVVLKGVNTLVYSSLIDGHAILTGGGQLCYEAKVLPGRVEVTDESWLWLKNNDGMDGAGTGELIVNQGNVISSRDVYDGNDLSKLRNMREISFDATREFRFPLGGLQVENGMVVDQDSKPVKECIVIAKKGDPGMLYGVEVMGVPLDPVMLEVKQIVGDSWKWGMASFTYDHSKKLLRLLGHTFYTVYPAGNAPAVVNSLEGLTIDFDMRSSKISALNAAVPTLLLKADTRFQGVVKSIEAVEGQPVVSLEGATLTINKGADITLSGLNVSPLSGDGVSSLVVDGGITLLCLDPVVDLLSGLAGITLGEDVRVLSPSGAQVVGGNVQVSGVAVRERLVLGDRNTPLGLTIGDVAVTLNNYQLLNDGSVFPALKAGSMEYDPETKVLKLKDLVLRGEITVGIDGLKIEVTGKSLSESDLTLTKGTLTLTGSGSLQCAGVILKEKTTLHLREQVTLVAAGGVQYKGWSGKGQDVTLEIDGDATLLAKHVKVNSLRRNGGTDIQYPVGAFFDIDAGHSGENASIRDADKLALHVIIRKGALVDYGFELGSISVNDANVDFIVPGLFPVVSKEAISVSKNGGGEVDRLYLNNVTLDLLYGNQLASVLKVRATSALERVEVSGQCVFYGRSRLFPSIISERSELTFSSQEPASLRIEAEHDYSSSGGVPGIQIPANTKVIFAGNLSTFVSGDVGIRGADKTTSVLEVKGATLQVKSLATVEKAVVNSVKVELSDGAQIHEPVGHSISAAGDILDSDGKVAKEVLISAAALEDYGFELRGIPITSLNTPLLSALIGSGTSYDPASKTLTFAMGGYLHGEDHIGLFVKSGTDLKVRMVGRSKIVSKKSAVVNEGKLIFDGSGSLEIGGKEDAVRLGEDAMLKFAGGLQASLKGDLAGIRGPVSKNAVVEVEDAYLAVEGQKVGSIVGLKAFTYPSTMVLLPEGAAFDAAQGFVGKEGKVCLEEVQLGFVPYDFAMGGVEVTSQNVDKLSDMGVFPALKGGSVSYDKASRTLKLTGVELAADLTNALSIKENGPQFIELEGNNTLTSIGAAALDASIEQLTLRGEGSLVGFGVDGLRLPQEKAKLVMESGKISLTGKAGYGLNVHNSATVSLGRALQLTMEGKQGAMSEMKSLKRDELYVVEPSDGVYDAGQGLFFQGLTVAKKVSLKHLAMSVEPAELVLQLGKSEQPTLNVAIEPSDVVSTYTLTADDPAKVQIDGTKITPLAVGETLVRVRADVSAELVRMVNVKVIEYTPVIQITLQKDGANVDNLDLMLGSEIELKVVFDPAEPTDKSVRWEVLGSGELELTEAADKLSAKVKAVKPGSAMINVIGADGQSAFCYINVEKVELEKIELSKKTLALRKGFGEKLSVVYTPATGIVKDVEWKSSAPSIATVDAEGNVMGVAPGEAEITVTSKEDATKTDKCKVTVSDYTRLEGIEFDPAEVELTVMGTKSLKLKYTPANATTKDIESWVSDNEEIVKVSNRGVVEGVSEGEATITATSKEGGYVATCKVIVVPQVHVTSVALDSTELTIVVKKTKVLNALVQPTNASIKTVKWSSDNEAIATVDGGTVTGVAEGVATITVKTVDGGKTATCKVTVVPEKESSVESLLLSGVRVAPNPFDAQITLRGATALARYELLSATGVVVSSGMNEGADEVVLNAAHLPAGIYLLRLHAADGERVVRLVKR